MPLLPHPPLYLTQIRVADIWALLALGALWELLTRLVAFNQKRKPNDMMAKEEALEKLEKETERYRKLGPSAFVETSKLERQVLSLERELERLRESRKEKAEMLEKKILKRGNMLLSLLIFILYYGVPLLTVEEVDVGNTEADRKVYLKSLLFPLASMGMGVRFSRLGMPAEIAFNSIGALMIMWSSQVTVGKLMDAFDAMYL
jgi:hypothetical protein